MIKYSKYLECLPILIILQILFLRNLTEGAVTCSCNCNGNEAVLEEFEQSLKIMTNRQLKEVQQLKEILRTSEVSPSAFSHLEEIEKQTAAIRSLFDSPSTAETFCEKVSNTTENNKKSIEELKAEHLTFQQQQENKIVIVEKDFQQKIEVVGRSIKEMESVLNGKIISVDKEFATLKLFITKAEKDIFKTISEVQKDIVEMAFNCTSYHKTLQEIMQTIQTSKGIEDSITDEIENHLREHTKLEEHIKDLQMKHDEIKQYTEENVHATNEKLSTFENSIKNVEETASTIRSQMEATILEKDSVNNKLNDLNLFMNVVKKNLDSIRFFLIDESLVYHDAENICKEYGGRLAVIPDASVQRLVENVVRTARQSGAWIGMKSNGRKDGIFEWNDGRTVNTKKKHEGFQKWQAVNPEDYPKGSVCVRILSKSGEWTDDFCSWKQGALCELLL